MFHYKNKIFEEYSPHSLARYLSKEKKKNVRNDWLASIKSHWPQASWTPNEVYTTEYSLSLGYYDVVQ